MVLCYHNAALPLVETGEENHAGGLIGVVVVA